jgi:hypothetical protein
LAYGPLQRSVPVLPAQASFDRQSTLSRSRPDWQGARRWPSRLACLMTALLVVKGGRPNRFSHLYPKMSSGIYTNGFWKRNRRSNHTTPPLSEDEQWNMYKSSHLCLLASLLACLPRPLDFYPHCCSFACLLAFPLSLRPVLCCVPWISS